MILERVDLDGLSRLAATLAPRLRAGDALALWGDLGAGKTAFARFLIRALLEDSDAEVASPSFPLVQIYETPRLTVSHFDFYRLSSPAEASETGLDDALADDLVLIEWPERLGGALPRDRLDIRFEETEDPAIRRLTLEGAGAWRARLDRFAAWRGFIAWCGWGDALPLPLPGDASVRSYARLVRETRQGRRESALLMDAARQPDGPPIRDGLPYSRIAHLAEDVRPFVAVAGALRQAGVAAPEIYAMDLDQGFLLMEDFGDAVFTRGGVAKARYEAAAEVLLRLRAAPPPAALPCGTGEPYVLPPYDREALAIETELLLDWHLPAATGRTPAPALREDFNGLWSVQFDWLLQEPKGWVLRDFHSPNLLWRPGEEGLARVGVIDFQDAVIGHAAYDLVSLLQDARQDVPPDLEAELFNAYCAAAARAEAGFDREAFTRAYALLGAQRAVKILGIFARLARRDGKRAYLARLPHVARSLIRNLEHPALSALRAWRDRELPDDVLFAAL